MLSSVHLKELEIDSSARPALAEDYERFAKRTARSARRICA